MKKQQRGFIKQIIGVTLSLDNPCGHKIPALVLGDLAIHRGLIGNDLKPLGSWYVVTHIPTGYKIAENDKQMNCRRLVVYLQRFNVGDYTTSEQVRDDVNPVVRAFNSLRTGEAWGEAA